MASKSVIQLIIEGVDNFSKDINKGVESTSKKLQSIGGSMQKMGGIMTASLTAPIVAAFGKAVFAASDLQESIGAVETVFGDAADTILEFGETSATAVGMSQEEFNSLGLITGSLLQNLGYDAEDAADSTTALATRAADMAAVFNTDVSQALEAINSGLKGEMNPLESFGVKLNAAGVEAKAMEMGLADVNGELDDNAKAQAALAIIMEQTNRIQGTFTRESESLGGSMKRLKAQLGDAAAQLGQQLLPYVTQAIQFFSGLVAKFRELSPETQKIIVIVGLFAAAIGPLLVVLGTLISTMGTVAAFIGGTLLPALSGLLAPIAAIIAIVALLAIAWKNDWGGIQEKTKTAIEFIKNTIKTALDAIGNWWSEHGEAIMATVQEMWDKVKNAFDKAIAFVEKIIQGALDQMRVWWDAYGADVMAIVDNLWDKVKSAFDTAMEFIKKIVDGALKIIKGWWEAHGQTVMIVVQNLWDSIKAIFEWGKETLGMIIKAIRSALEGDWTAFGETLREIWDNTWELIKTILSNAWDSIKIIVVDLITSIVSFFTETDWGQVGKNIVRGIADGITAGPQWTIDAIKKLAGNIFDAITGFFDSSSPSKLMAKLGDDLDKGLAIGIEHAAKLPIEEMGNLAKRLIPNLSPDIMGSNMNSLALGFNGQNSALSSSTINNNFTIQLQGNDSAAKDVASTIRLMEMIYI